MNDKSSKRKHPWLKDFDYSQNGAYFVTICVKDQKPILSKINVELTEIGKIAKKYI